MWMLNLIVACAFCVLNWGNALSSSPLGPYKISDVTVSGISSGGYMAVQLHISHSSIVNGSAVFAGGPFYCAEGDLYFAEYKCMKTVAGLPNVVGLVALTESDASFGYVDPVHNLKDDRVYLFSGSDDSVVDPNVVLSLQAYYNSFVQPSNIVADFAVKAEHCYPTVNYGENCATLGSPYIGKCDFDGAGAAFTTLFGNLKPKVEMVSANLMSFNQKPYWTNSVSSLADTGYIYVPSSCATGQTSCHLHVAFHGCLQTQVDIGNVFATNTGMNEWAESNNIIVLYPYATESQAVPLNPNGCWDWWGYTGVVYYGTKLGDQMQFVRKLISAVSGK